MNTPVVFVADEQSEHAVDAGQWMRLAGQVLAAQKAADGIEMSVLYVDETTIADLNERFLGKSGPTDVLSFPIDEGPEPSGRIPDAGGTGPGSPFVEEESLLLLGDVVICPAVAARNAVDHAGTYDDELALLLVHGILHLLGMDHTEEAEAAIMERRERELLEQFWRPVRREAWS